MLIVGTPPAFEETQFKTIQDIGYIEQPVLLKLQFPCK
jgi:hypothetical protein